MGAKRRHLGQGQVITSHRYCGMYVRVPAFDTCFSCPCPCTCFWYTGGCLTNVSRALHIHLAKMHNARNHIYGENFKLKLCMCTRTKFQLEILIWSTISAIHEFRENISESSRNVSETTPRSSNAVATIDSSCECHETIFLINKLYQWVATIHTPSFVFHKTYRLPL